MCECVCGALLAGSRKRETSVFSITTIVAHSEDTSTLIKPLNLNGEYIYFARCGASDATDILIKIHYSVFVLLLPLQAMNSDGTRLTLRTCIFASCQELRYRSKEMDIVVFVARRVSRAY